jgi:hypothetical protein
MPEENEAIRSTEGSAIAVQKREPIVSALCSSISYLRESAAVEGTKRQIDLVASAMLPVSSLLLVMAICLIATPQIKMLSFLIPVLALGYFVATRIAIVKTMNQRQAYLTWHILLATFMLGAAFSLFMCYVCTCLVMWATRSS